MNDLQHITPRRSHSREWCHSKIQQSPNFFGKYTFQKNVCVQIRWPWSRSICRIWWTKNYGWGPSHCIWWIKFDGHEAIIFGDKKWPFATVIFGRRQFANFFCSTFALFLNKLPFQNSALFYVVSFLFAMIVFITFLWLKPILGSVMSIVRSNTFASTSTFSFLCHKSMRFINNFLSFPPEFFIHHNIFPYSHCHHTELQSETTIVSQLFGSKLINNKVCNSSSI